MTNDKRYIIHDLLGGHEYLLQLGDYVIDAQKLGGYGHNTLDCDHVDEEHPEGYGKNLDPGDRPYQLWLGPWGKSHWIDNPDIEHRSTDEFHLGDDIFVWDPTQEKYFRGIVVGILLQEFAEKEDALKNVDC